MDGLVRDRLRFKESMGVTEGVRVGRMAGVGKDAPAMRQAGAGLPKLHFHNLYSKTDFCKLSLYFHRKPLTWSLLQVIHYSWR